AQLEALVLIAAYSPTATLDNRLLAEPGRLRADRRQRGGLRRRERDLRAALEVDPEIEALHGKRADRDHDDRARDREPEVALAHEVDLQPAPALLAARAHEARVLEPAEAGEQSEHRARGRDGGDQRDDGADHQHQR